MPTIGKSYEVRHCGVFVAELETSENDPARLYALQGEEAMSYLPNAREVRVKGGDHAVDTHCTERLIVQFERARSAQELDIAQCSAEYTLPPFATSMKGWPQL